MKTWASHEIADAWADGVAACARSQGVRLSGQWEYVSVGPLPWGGNATVEDGSVIKFDVGCLVDGYSSDCGRTYTFGRAGSRAREIMAALSNAFDAGLEVLKPGRLLSDVYAQAARAMQRAGFRRYARGHFGHSLGRDTFCEVPPFVAAQAHEPIEPGMVLAFETPFYVDGEGGFIIEDQFLITDTGAEAAWSLPRDLVELGVMTRNEARRLEGLPALPGLDEPLTPLNMQGGEPAAARVDQGGEDGPQD